MASFPDPMRIFSPKTSFEALAEELWQFQLAHNPVVKRFCHLLGQSSQTFIPIRFFKQFEMVTAPGWESEALFSSSGTTGQETSSHLVRDLSLYEASLHQGLRHFYGGGQYSIFALLPNYLERQNSSLVYMVQAWIEKVGRPGSGFYLYDHQALLEALVKAGAKNERILLIGVSFALLDFVEAYTIKLPDNAIVMETGGMKGRRKEMVREELHALLRKGLGVDKIHSEYGMTELLSQAYALGGNRFRCPPWMKVVITDPYIPGRETGPGRTGRINVIDLANVWSCAFIQTEDLGKSHPDGSFEVLGRMDHAEMRGCNLMVAD